MTIDRSAMGRSSVPGCFLCRLRRGAHRSIAVKTGDRPTALTLLESESRREHSRSRWHHSHRLGRAPERLEWSTA